MAAKLAGENGRTRMLAKCRETDRKLSIDRWPPLAPHSDKRAGEAPALMNDAGITQRLVDPADSNVVLVGIGLISGD